MDLMYCGGDFDISLQELIECDLKSEIGNHDLMSELANGPLLSDDGFDDMDNLDHHVFDPSYALSYGLNSAASLRTSVIGSHRHFINGHGGISSANSYSNISFDEQQYVMVDPSSIVPNSVSGSLGSTGSASETDLGTDEDEDEELVSQGWIVTNAEGGDTPSPIPISQEYELIEEPEFIMESEPVVEGPPPKKRKQKHEPQPHTDGKIYPKPGFSYSCLIAMSLKNSKVGSLPVSEIYKFMCDHFPYFKTAPSGWKNSVRHNLSLNKCFEKIEKPGNAARKGCLWALNPTKIHKMDEEVQKWLKKDPGSVIRAMSDPENLELIERGELKRDYSGNAAGASDDDEEEDESLSPMRGLTPNARNANRQTTALATSVVGGDTIITATPVTMSQIRASLQQQHLRIIKQDGEGVAIDDQQMFDLTQMGMGSVQGNYLSHSNGTFTISFTGVANQSTAPLIIRRTPVK